MSKQRYECRECKRTLRENPQRQTYTPQSQTHTLQRQAEVLRAYEERSSLRGLERIFGVSRHTVSAWLKKSS